MGEDVDNNDKRTPKDKRDKDEYISIADANRLMNGGKKRKLRPFEQWVEDLCSGKEKL